jgi:hypothetical protein
MLNVYLALVFLATISHSLFSKSILFRRMLFLSETWLDCCKTGSQEIAEKQHKNKRPFSLFLLYSHKHPKRREKDLNKHVVVNNTTVHCLCVANLLIFFLKHHAFVHFEFSVQIIIFERLPSKLNFLTLKIGFVISFEFFFKTIFLYKVCSFL